MPFPRTARGLLILVALTLIPSQLVACALCIGFPKKTVADHLLECHCALLARNTTENLFAYAPMTVLKGNYDNSEIELLVDSRTRRVLSNEANQHVLLIQNQRDGKWSSFGIVNPEYLAVIQRIIGLKPQWTGRNGDQARCQFFAQLFAHADPKIRQLAYLEVGRAPYSVIKQLGKIAPRASYEQFLKDPKYLKWRSLAILLLAQSDQATDRQYVLDSFQAAQRLGLTSNLAAWTAAAVEVQGIEAIDSIETNYFQSTDKPIEEIRAVSQALVTLGSQSNSATQDRIIDGFRQLIIHHPVVASEIADDLQAWRRFELADRMSEILLNQDSLGYKARHSIRQYIRAAESSQAHDD